MSSSITELYERGIKVGDIIRNKANGRVGTVIDIRELKTLRPETFGHHEVDVRPIISFDPEGAGYSLDTAQTFRPGGFSPGEDFELVEEG